MNWFLFAVLAWIMLGLDVGFRDVVQLGSYAVAPSFMLVLAVFVSMWAAEMQVVAACLAIGLLVDLTHVTPTSTGEAIVIIGPYAIGYVIAGAFMINARPMLLRRNPITFIVLCVLCMLVTEVVQLLFLQLRGAYDELALLGLRRELGQRLGAVAMTAALAALLGPVLHLIAPAMGLDVGHGGRRR